MLSKVLPLSKIIDYVTAFLHLQDGNITEITYIVI